MIRVLVVASTFPARDDDPVPAFVKDQVIAFKQAYPDMEFSVLAPHDARSQTPPYVKHTHYDEYRFHYIWPFRLEKLAGRGIVPALQENPARYALIPFLVGAEFFALLRLTRKLHPDVIYAHWFTPQGITAGMVSAVTGVPFVYTSHSSDVAILRKVPKLGPVMVRHFTKKARAITVVSQRSLKKLQTFFSDTAWQEMSHKVAVIPMGVPLLVAEQSQHAHAKASKNILFIGRLAEKKGVQYLLPAFAELLKKHTHTTLTIAGDGPWREQLQSQASKLKLSGKQITFPGYVSGETKAKMIDAADIYVVPSIITDSGDAEGLPVSLMEGLAAGKICIATNESGADDILANGKNGYLVPQKDITALSEALEKALALTPEQHRAMRVEAKQVAQQFAWPSIARQHYLHLFRVQPTVPETANITS
jgi:glycosyltransferase involved in cell wall biosynthesis